MPKRRLAAYPGSLPWIALSLSLALIACGGGAEGDSGSGTGGAKADAGGQTQPDIAAQEDTSQAEDAGSAGLDAGGTVLDAAGQGDVGQSEDGGTEDAGTPDTGPAQCPGAPGCDCVKNDDCDNGACIDTAEGRKCAKSCVSDCPSGFSCKQFGSTDVIFVCIPNYVSICAPCTKNSDCKVQGTDALCLDYGPNGRFCGGLCGQDADCPTGYECVDAYNEDTSKLSKQCKQKKLVEAGSGKTCTGDTDCDKGEGCAEGKCALVSYPLCGCSLWAKATGLKTSCKVTNAFGSCPGERSCGDNGLSSCSGGEPAKDVCDGVDNDCDGQTDAGSCDDQDACTEDTCDPGAGGCQNKANVNCDDGNQCTTDSCDKADGKCVATALVGSCDDGNACTVGDVCGVDQAGVGICQPGADAKQCDDGNLCTDDSCAQDQGCVHLPNSASQTCYTGDKGTEGVGVCAGGKYTCAGGKLGDVCEGQKVPAAKEACDGQDDNCDGVTDEGCNAAAIQGGFASAGGRVDGGNKTMIASMGGESAAGTVTDKKTLQAGFLAWLLSVF